MPSLCPTLSGLDLDTVFSVTWQVFKLVPTQGSLPYGSVFSALKKKIIKKKKALTTKGIKGFTKRVSSGQEGKLKVTIDKCILTYRFI